SDLAENKNDLNMVLDYVKSQLLELGIRFPKVYPVSSKLSLEEKENGLSLNKEMSHFENEFYQFIEQDLAQLTIDSAVWDIERGKQLLINYIKTVGLSDEEQIDYVESLKNNAAEIQNLVKEFNYSVYESRLLERIMSNYFIDYVGYELLQELRAVSLRVESYLHELIHDVYNQINENINETDNTYLLSSLKDYEVITPDYEQAFLNIDYSKFDHAL